MGKKWTEGYPRPDNITDPDDLNKYYDAMKGWANGGMDRTSFGEKSISDGMVKDEAFQKIVLNTAIELDSSLQTSNGGQGVFSCLEYDYYPGGWIRHGSSYQLTDLHEGMMHVEFSCWTWSYNYETWENPKRSAWRIIYNGVIVAETRGIFGTFNNPFICCDFPIPGGDGTLEIEWRYQDPDAGVDTATENQFMWGGGNLLAKATWR